jgi:oligosaccharide repeat unit polymerase
MIILCLCLLFVLVLANFWLHRDPLYPGFLQALVWFVALSLLLLTHDMFIPVSDRTFILIVTGALFFTIGAFTASYSHTPTLSRNYVRSGSLTSKGALLVLAAIVVLGLFPYLRRILELASTGPSTNAFINLRHNASVDLEETGGIGRVSYFMVLSYVLVGIVMLRAYGERGARTSRVALGVVVFVAAVYGVLSSGRGQILSLLLTALLIPLVLRAIRPARTGLAVVLIGLLLFASVGIALGKGGTLGNTVADNFSTMRESLALYSVGGIPTLNSYLDNRPPDLEMGVNSLRSVFAVLQVLGLQNTAAPLVQPYIDIPMPMNVYTVYHPYIKDFGLLGGILVLFVLGFVHGVVYRRATQPNPPAIWVFLFAVSVFPLAMQAFQDVYFSLLALWIQYAVYAVVLLVIFSEAGVKSLAPRLAVSRIELR